MKLYYTPEIEEFHIGFEYEMIPSIGVAVHNFEEPNEKVEIKWATEYQKGIYGVKNIGFYGGIPDIVAAIKEDKCRVKYLDDNDLKDLGFEFIPNSYAGSYSNGKLRAAWWWNKKGLEIYQESNQEFGGKHLFCGKIKNKSELKKLLKQLEIDE